jgi:uncharacterized surface protein with fasciclin (FAS1) repeats
MSISMFRRFIAIICIGVIAGCTQARQQATPPPPNAGVDLVPPAILAAEKITPDAQPATSARPDLIQVLSRSEENHQEILRALRLADLVPMLRTAGPYTLLAPTDEAFAKLPPGTMDRLLEPANHQQLRAWLQYHILKGRISFDELLATNGQVKTLSGQSIIVRGVDHKVMIDDANVIRSENAASNGVIHWIDGVLLPPAK